MDCAGGSPAVLPPRGSTGPADAPVAPISAPLVTASQPDPVGRVVRVSRRQLVKTMAAGALGLVLSGVGQAPLGRPSLATARTRFARAGPAGQPAGQPVGGGSAGLRGFAFGTVEKDLTIFDITAWQPLETRPLGATVRWLSNEQRFWDGRYIWTYDFPDNVVQAIAIDPLAARVARVISTGGTGPAHSLMLTPDLRTAWVNSAGDNRLNVIDLAAGEIVAQVETGQFP